jgi:hypothetical protein
VLRAPFSLLPRTLIQQVAIYIEPRSALFYETAAFVMANGCGVADTGAGYEFDFRRISACAARVYDAQA